MPTLSNKQLMAVNEICRSYGIKFVGTVEPGDWPDCHRKILQNVSELGQCKLRSYAVDQDNVNRNSPWKKRTKDRALHLVQRAKRNVQRNEGTWRHGCEGHVFERFLLAFTCKVCHRRIWRSEIEVTADTGTSSGKDLAWRQRKREPCQCPFEPPGLNIVFGQRQENILVLEEKIAARFGQKSQKVDAAYGLREAGSIVNLWEKARIRQAGLNTDRKRPNSSPLKQPLDELGDKLLYPFLVVEAKSGKAGCEWDSIDKQAALPIRIFLQAQQRLYEAAKIEGQSELLWFVSSQGSTWRVSMCYMQKDTSGHGADSIVIIDAWEGSIIVPDGALQLLLLVDYIFDWACDAYRADIIRRLEVLAFGNIDEAAIGNPDTDVFSTRQLQLEVASVDTGDDEDCQPGTTHSQLDPELKKAVRNASAVENRYFCLFVTWDNLLLLQHTGAWNHKYTTRLYTAISQAPANFLLLEQSTIVALERLWTGRQSAWPPHTLRSQARFYTQVTCSSYLSSQWSQVRELCLLAIETSVWSRILRVSPKTRFASMPRTSPCTASLLEHINRLQAGTMTDTLLACIGRRAIIFKQTSMRKDSVCHFHWTPTQTEEHAEGEPAEPTAPTDADVSTRDTVRYAQRVLRRAPEQSAKPFIKQSKRLIMQHLLPATTKVPLWPPSTRPEMLQVAGNDCVLVQGTSVFENTKKVLGTIMCMYVLGADALGSDSRDFDEFEHARHDEMMRDAFETRDMYHTTLDEIIRGLGSLRNTWWSQMPWNISGTYGVCQNLEKRARDLLCTSARVGAPRIENEASSGAHLHTRRPNPWRDPRQHTRSCAKEVFVFYKLMMAEFDYWGRIAAGRVLYGTWACCWCAGTRVAGRYSAVCRDCYEACEPGGAFRWLGGFLETRLRSSVNRGDDGGGYEDYVEDGVYDEPSFEEISVDDEVDDEVDDGDENSIYDEDGVHDDDNDEGYDKDGIYDENSDFDEYGVVDGDEDDEEDDEDDKDEVDEDDDDDDEYDDNEDTRNEEYKEDEEYEEDEKDEDTDEDEGEPGPLDEKWYPILCEYPDLKQPFNTLEDLGTQSRRFQHCFEHRLGKKREKRRAQVAADN